jgi:hypothetical protein
MSPNHEFSLMSIAEKSLLRKLAKDLAPASVVVEVGTYLGGSASIMAEANPAIKIFTYDLYNGQDSDPFFGTSLVEKALGAGVERTLESVSKVTNSYQNIELRRSLPRLPGSFKWQGDPIDLLFDDGDHTVQGLPLNLNYWLQFLKDDGIIALHDCRPWLHLAHNLRWPGVEIEVERLVSLGYTKVLQVDSLVILQKVAKKQQKDLDETK